MAPLSPHAKFGPQQVLEYTVDTVESDEEDVPADLAEKLKSNERGVNGTPRRRKISYVQEGGGCGGGGGGPKGGAGVADLVVLSEYDENGKLAHRGTCIIKGVQRKFAKIKQDPMTHNKKGEPRQVEMQYQVVQTGKPNRQPLSGNSATSRAKAPLALDPEAVPQPSELPNKPQSINAPPTRTRTEATPWKATHHDSAVSAFGLTAKSMQSIHFQAVAASLLHTHKTFDAEATAVDVESAARAHANFQQRGSFAERERLRMSKRRFLARQPPAILRVRQKPTVGRPTALRGFPRATANFAPSSPQSPRSLPRALLPQPSDMIRLEGERFDLGAGADGQGQGNEGVEAERLEYSPGPGSLSRSPEPKRVDSPPQRLRPMKPMSGVSCAALDRPASAPSLHSPSDKGNAAKQPVFGAPHISAAIMPAPAQRPAALLQRPSTARSQRSSVSISGIVGSAAAWTTRSRSVPVVPGGTGAGGNDKGVKQNMLRSLNAAFNSERISERVWKSAVTDLEAKAKSGVATMNTAVYLQRAGDQPGQGYLQPTSSTTLKVSTTSASSAAALDRMSIRPMSARQSLALARSRPTSARAVLQKSMGQVGPSWRPGSATRADGRNEARSRRDVLQAEAWGGKRLGLVQQIDARASAGTRGQFCSEGVRGERPAVRRSLSAVPRRRSHCQWLMPYPNRPTDWELAEKAAQIDALRNPDVRDGC